MKKYLFLIIYGILLLAFTVFAALDVFVIPHNYGSVEEDASLYPVSPYEKILEEEMQTSDVSANVTSVNEILINELSVSDNLEAAKTSEIISEAVSVNKVSENASSDIFNSESLVKNTDNISNNIIFNYDNPELGEISETIVADSNLLGSYNDGNVSVSVSEYRYCDTEVYVANVYLTSAGYLKTAFANDTYGKNIKNRTSDIANANSAIVAINGDFYGARENGYVIRNGVLFQDTVGNKSQDLAIYYDGSFEAVFEEEISAKELLDKGVRHIFSFGPALVENGEIVVTKKQEVAHAMASNPRTAIGYIEEGHYILLVSDGRTDESRGLKLYELALFMQAMGVKEAYNLDGGGSSAMVFDGKIINKPTSDGVNISERRVSDIVYIGY